MKYKFKPTKTAAVMSLYNANCIDFFSRRSRAKGIEDTLSIKRTIDIMITCSCLAPNARATDSDVSMKVVDKARLIMPTDVRAMLKTRWGSAPGFVANRK